jgi:outer membrane protein assembly factor BamB
MRLVAGLAVLLALVCGSRADDNWPAFRGGGRPGTVEGDTLPSTWDKSKNVRWVVEIPGRGWSSPIVWGDRVFLTTAISKAKQPDPRKGLYIADLNGKVRDGEHEWAVLCLDAKTGKTLWQKTAFQGKAGAPLHIKNTLASETPVTDGEHVCAYFGNVGVACYTVEGKELWSQKLPARKTRMGWGTGASPALYQGKLFLLNDNEEESALTALDVRTGKEVWRQTRKEGSNWTTPFVWKNSERAEVVTAGTGRVRSYDLDGKQLWELKGMSIISIPSPFAADGLLYVTSGYVADPFLRPLYAIRPGARGDVSLKEGKTSNEAVVWCQSQAGPYHPTPVVFGQHIYVLLDRGFLSCYEAKTGKVVYEPRRLGGGASAFTASPWACGGKVFCLSEDGETFVVQAGAEFKVLGRNPLEEMTLATPALAGGSLFLRTQGKLYCLRQEK